MTSSLGRAIAGDDLRRRVRLGCLPVELVADEEFVADDPGVVPWLDDVRLSSGDLRLTPVFVLDMHPSRLHHAHMVDLALLGSDDRLDALRPPPPGLEGEAGHRSASHPDYLGLRLVRRTSLVGRIEVAGLDTSHRSPPLVSSY